MHHSLTDSVVKIRLWAESIALAKDRGPRVTLECSFNKSKGEKAHLSTNEVQEQR